MGWVSVIVLLAPELVKAGDLQCGLFWLCE